jgi:hypothetical protein
MSRVACAITALLGACVTAACGGPSALADPPAASPCMLGGLTITVDRAPGGRPALDTACERGGARRVEVASDGQLWVHLTVGNTGPHVVDLRDATFALADTAGSATGPLTRDQIAARFAERCPAWRPEDIPLPDIALLDQQERLFPSTTWSGWLVFPQPSRAGPLSLGLYGVPVAFDAIGAVLRTAGARISIDPQSPD